MISYAISPTIHIDPNNAHICQEKDMSYYKASISDLILSKTYCGLIEYIHSGFS